jgi:tetratricopeptide (TPR) repeat protein
VAQPKSSIVFLSVPESLRGRIEEARPGAETSFVIDPGIPIPVELPPKDGVFDPEDLSWEMILSGMIRVVAEDPAGEDADYYRRFVLTVKPDILEEFTEAAILKAKNGDYDMALEILFALKGLFPQSPVVLLNRALILEERADRLDKAGREAEAEAENGRAHEAYREVLALSPPFPNGLFNAGFFYLRRRNFDKARDCFSAYIPLAKDPEKEKQAGAILREIETHNLDDELFREAYDFIRLGEEQKGLLKIRTFLEHHPMVWNGWFILGWALRRQGRWEDAAEAFYKALELGGSGGDTRNELAICLMEMGKHREARRELETALRDEPENIKIISNLGVLALRQGEDDEAAGFFRTVLELEPEDPVARKYLGIPGEAPEGETEPRP